MDSEWVLTQMTTYTATTAGRKLQKKWRNTHVKESKCSNDAISKTTEYMPWPVAKKSGKRKSKKVLVGSMAFVV